MIHVRIKNSHYIKQNTEKKVITTRILSTILSRVVIHYLINITLRKLSLKFQFEPGKKIIRLRLSFFWIKRNIFETNISVDFRILVT